MSFYYAISGIWAAMRQEPHLRFHFAVTNLILVFAYFYEISAAEWAILILMCGAVISAEIMNTAVERAVDTATKERCASAKLAKDAAAGAVLVLAAVSVAVGICLFGNTEKIGAALAHIFGSAKTLMLCIALGILDICFIIFGGKNDK